MNKSQLEFILSEVHALTFVNPFSAERNERENAILAKLGDAPSAAPTEGPFGFRFKKLLPWFREAERSLLADTKSTLPAKWREQLASLAFFTLYHEVAADLDRLIQRGTADPMPNRKLYRKIQDGVAARHRLIEHGPERIWNRPDHLFACFYQLRRAYYYIHKEIVGESRPICQLRMQVWESVFTKDMMSYQQWMYDTVGRFPTLILGPSGSGKEIVARAIGLSRFFPYNPKTAQFEASPEDSFHPVNLSALSEHLIESELFGHRKGAFTGAISDREGLFATAGNYGSVFLDEIGEVGEATQVKLLRLLQSGEYQAIGDNRPDHFTGKIIAATHKDLIAEMEAGRFREDFFYRLCGDQVRTAALKDILQDRPEELSTSINYICKKLFGAEGARELAGRVLTTLEQQVPKHYSWPGNFRELEQAVRNIIVRNEYKPVSPQPNNQIEQAYQNTSLTLQEWNQLYAKKAYENTGSYREAARRLNVDQRTLKKLTTT
ncbi:sigma-54-dependent transcriptional regulator [Coraliomargarita parva]|uniref:sigma-54-dependent transcriptional regulator n=1 Tax=Coraliomargarita parva TaxID=3014050 RepID=UPI0022B55BE8|nr:sigma-54 factor interaction domain-containing protein [Coraliomargarita parva]